MALFTRAARRSTRLAVALLIVTSACSRNNPETGAAFDPSPEPISVFVKNENFLDMNVSLISGGVTRRLGQVSGNGSGEFKVNASVANGQSVGITAVPIGQSGRYTSPGLQVRPGQRIEVRLASSLRQSTTVVRDP
jgi:hypothetical protein